MELAQVSTLDGLRLDGAFYAPPASGSAALGLDAVCLVHGTGGNFYSSGLFDSLAERLLSLGCAVLRINTRGHDGISTAATARGGKRLGAAYELVDDCRKDLAAWMDWLRKRCGQRLGLVGHSLGAVKSLYALAHEPDLAVRCVVAISPPRLSYSWFCSNPEGPGFLETYAEAARLLEGGKPSALLDVGQPMSYVVTAAGFIEKYGPDERYNYVRFLAGVRCPVLVTFGSIEVANSMAFRGVPDKLAELKQRQSQLAVAIVTGGDHFYTGVRGELVNQVEAWLRSNQD